MPWIYVKLLLRPRPAWDDQADFDSRWRNLRILIISR
jgi:hypothetical protein